MIRNGRRSLIAVLLAVSFSWTPQAGAEPVRHVVHVGRFGDTLAAVRAASIERFAKHGFVEGRNLRYELIENAGREDEFPELARRIVAGRPDAIIASGDRRAVVFKKTTGDIPIIFHSVGDPVATGLVASLQRPGSNVTGSSSRDTELAAKRLEALLEVTPAARRVAWASVGDEVGRAHLRELERAGASRKIAIVVADQLSTTYLALNARTARQIGVRFPDTLLLRADQVLE